jgi:hypothetical protein
MKLLRNENKDKETKMGAHWGCGEGQKSARKNQRARLLWHISRAFGNTKRRRAFREHHAAAQKVPRVLKFEDYVKFAGVLVSGGE